MDRPDGSKDRSCPIMGDGLVLVYLFCGKSRCLDGCAGYRNEVRGSGKDWQRIFAVGKKAQIGSFAGKEVVAKRREWNLAASVCHRRGTKKVFGRYGKRRYQEWQIRRIKK